MESEIRAQFLSDAAKVRELLAHPGLAVVKRKAEELIQRDFGKWAMEPDPVKAEAMRVHARGYQAFFGIIQTILVQAQQAERQPTQSDPA